MASVALKPRSIASLRSALPLLPVASSSRALHPFAPARKPPRKDDEREGEAFYRHDGQGGFDLSDLTTAHQRGRAKATLGKAKAAEVNAAQQAILSEDRFEVVFTALRDHLKSAPRAAKTIDRAQVDELLQLADNGLRLYRVFQLCCLMRARAVPVDRAYSAAYYHRCIKYGYPRLAVSSMTSSKRSGLVPPTQAAVWLAMDALRESIKPGEVEAAKQDSDRAINTAFKAVAELPTYNLTAVDPFVLSQLMAMCLRAQTERSLDLFAGLEGDLRSVITPWQFGRAYWQTRSHKITSLPICFDKALTPIRQYLGEAIKQPDVEEGIVAPEALAAQPTDERERLEETLVAPPPRPEDDKLSQRQIIYWRAVFSHVDKVRQTGQVSGGDRDPDDHRVERKRVLGEARGKYAGPVRKGVPYGQPLHRVATIDGQVVRNPHEQSTLARSTRWIRGPRADAANTATAT